MMRFIMKNKVTLNIAIVLFWLIIWQLIYLIIAKDLYIPAPLAVLESLKELVQTPVFYKIVSVSIIRVIAGLLISFVLGVILGVLSGINKLVYKFLKPLITVIRATPAISFIIIALIWFESTYVPIFISFLMCFPIIWTNVGLGIKSVDKKYLDLAKVYQISKIKKIKYIYVPSMKPYFKSSIINTLGLAWKVSVAAEVLSHPRYAIGSNLHSSKVYLDIPGLFAWTLVVVILSVIFENIFNFIVKEGDFYESKVK